MNQRLVFIHTFLVIFIIVQFKCTKPKENSSDSNAPALFRLIIDLGGTSGSTTSGSATSTTSGSATSTTSGTCLFNSSNFNSGCRFK